MLSVEKNYLEQPRGFTPKNSEDSLFCKAVVLYNKQIRVIGERSVIFCYMGVDEFADDWRRDCTVPGAPIELFRVVRLSAVGVLSNIIIPKRNDTFSCFKLVAKNKTK
jgi:hypothetical protein